MERTRGLYWLVRRLERRVVRSRGGGASSRGRPVAGGGSDREPEAPKRGEVDYAAVSLVTQLERLTQLWESGALSDEEFVQAKRRVLL